MGSGWRSRKNRKPHHTGSSYSNAYSSPPPSPPPPFAPQSTQNSVIRAPELPNTQTGPRYPQDKLNYSGHHELRRNPSQILNDFLGITTNVDSDGDEVMALEPRNHPYKSHSFPVSNLNNQNPQPPSRPQHNSSYLILPPPISTAHTSTRRKIPPKTALSKRRTSDNEKTRLLHALLASIADIQRNAMDLWSQMKPGEPCPYVVIGESKLISKSQGHCVSNGDAMDWQPEPTIPVCAIVNL